MIFLLSTFIWKRILLLAIIWVSYKSRKERGGYNNYGFGYEKKVERIENQVGFQLLFYFPDTSNEHANNVICK